MTRRCVSAVCNALSWNARWIALTVAIAIGVSLAASAQPVDVPPTWGGDIWSRPRLTGDWFGYRDEMSKRGVVFDLDFLQILQGTATGGRDTGVSYGGVAEYTLNVDTGKLKLWPGGFFKVYAMSGFGDSENRDASDGLVNPVKYAYNVGLSGNGVVPGRPDDAFGVGWSRIDFSDKFVPFLGKTLNLGLDHEDAVELYYSVAATKWLGLTVDLQIANPGLTKTLTSDGRLKDVDTAVVGGLRAFVRF